MSRKRGEGKRGVYWDSQKAGYVVQYADVDGKRRREFVGPSESAAAAIAKRRRQAVKEARLKGTRPTSSDGVLLVEFMAEVLRESRATKRTWRDDERYATYWGEAFPEHQIDQVTTADVLAWRQRRLAGKPASTDATSRPVAPATVNRAVAFLKRVYNVAISQGKATSNPVEKLRMLRENNARTMFLSPEQEQQLRSNFVPDKWHFVELALETGLRREEQMTLRWEHVDFAAGVITIPRSKHGERRHVPMSNRVREILEQLRRHRRGSPWVYPDETDPTKHASTYAHFQSAFKGAVKRAQLDGLRWHDLRHTFASRLVMAGIDLRTVAELLGHKSLAMVMRYSHLAPEHRQSAVQRMADMFRPQPPAG